MYRFYATKSVKDVEEGTLALAVHRMLDAWTLCQGFLIDYSTATKDQLTTHKLMTNHNYHHFHILILCFPKKANAFIYLSGFL